MMYHLILKASDLISLCEHKAVERSLPMPSSKALQNAKLFLIQAYKNGLKPNRVAPTTVGGVSVTYPINNKKIVIEFYNDGDMYAIFFSQGKPELKKYNPPWTDLINRIKKNYD